MFLTELTPLMKEMTKQPLAFFGGFCSGMFRVRLSDDPLKSWLEQQGVTPIETETSENEDNGNGPQSITIE